MTNQEYIRQWIESTEDAITALQEWRRNLREWRRLRALGVGIPTGEFHKALSELRAAGLEGWADNLDIDELADALCGEDCQAPVNAVGPDVDFR
jgi:hypothetical protein